MKFEFHNIGESKSALRKELAARPIAEKLRMLDALRERTLSIRRASKSGPAKKRRRSPGVRRRQMEKNEIEPRPGDSKPHTA